MKATEESTLKYAMYHSCMGLETDYLKMYCLMEETKLINISICEGNCTKELVINTEAFRTERHKRGYESGCQFQNIFKV